jgi:hypothetical protein
LFHLSFVLFRAPADLRQDRTGLTVNCDKEAVRVKAMHLDEPVLSGSGTVDDDEDEVVVAVDFGSLIELFRVLDGERVELETSRRIAKSPSVGLSRSSQKKFLAESRPSTVLRSKSTSSLPWPLRS